MRYKIGKKKKEEKKKYNPASGGGGARRLSRSAVKELVFSGVGKSMLEIGTGEVKEVVHREIFTEDIVIGVEAQNLLCKCK